MIIRLKGKPGTLSRQRQPYFPAHTPLSILTPCYHECSLF